MLLIRLSARTTFLHIECAQAAGNKGESDSAPRPVALRYWSRISSSLWSGGFAYGTLQATPLQSHVRSYASTPIASPRKSPLVLPVRIIFALLELQTPVLWCCFVTVSIRTDCFVRTSFEERR